MIESPREKTLTTAGESLFEGAFRLTLETAKWVFTTPRICVLIVPGFSIDAIVRNFVTINSANYHILAIPQ